MVRTRTTRLTLTCEKANEREREKERRDWTLADVETFVKRMGCDGYSIPVPVTLSAKVKEIHLNVFVLNEAMVK